jgi:hypothetical protein
VRGPFAPTMSRSGYGSEEDDLDIHVRRYQRDRSPGPQYVQTVRDNRPRGYYQSGPVFLAPERSSGTMITTRTSRSRSRDRRSSPPQQMAPVVIENKIINEHSSDSDSDYHHRHRHRDRSHSSSYHDDLAIERVRREYDEMRLRDEERERAARRALKDARDQSELIRAKAELDEIKRDQERHEAEKRAKRELELKYLEEERRREEEKKRREKEAEEAVEKYKLKEAERLAKEKEDKERAEKEYKARMTADLLAAGVDEKEIVAIIDKKKVKKDDKDRPTYTRMSLRHLDIETLVYYKIQFEYDQVSIIASTSLRSALSKPANGVSSYRSRALFSSSAGCPSGSRTCCGRTRASFAS